MNPKRVGVIAVLLVAAVGLAACPTPYHDQNERYVFVASNGNLPYWQEAQAGPDGRGAADGREGGVNRPREV